MRQLRLAGGRVAPARLHAAGLEITTVRARGNLAVGFLRRQPDFQVVGLDGREAHVAGAQQHLAVRQAQLFQHHFSAAGHALVFGIALFRATDRDQLDLLELVLADHAAHVAPAAAGLGTEAHRVGGHAQRQALGIDDLVAHDVGQRHFRGRDQVARGIAHGGLEQVVLELRQLAGAAQRIGVDQQRHVGFLITVLAGMQVDHELGQRTVQARDRAAQHGEARTGQLGRGLAVQPAIAGAQFDVVEHLEVELARGTPARLLDVVALIGTGRHVISRQVRDAHRDRFDLLAQFVQRHFRGLQLVGEGSNLGHDGRNVLALGLGLADGLGTAVAQALQFLGPHLDALAISLQGLQGRHVELEAAAGAQAFGEVGGLVAEQGWIKHGRCRGGYQGWDYRLLYGFLPPGSFPPWQNRAIPYWSGPCLHPARRPPSRSLCISRATP
ncbi:hypothetical protein BN126330174 [Stenotrophomonas thermophila]|nr:hypothetical protein BN126330174 [Stenotrophomonas maltophilia]